MKTAVFVFLGFIAVALSAKTDVESEEGATAKGHGPVAAAAAADALSGVGSGAIDGDGKVVGLASVGGAIVGALSSPYL